MDNVLGNMQRKRKRAIDLLFLIASAIVVAAVGVFAFWIADNHNLTLWLFAGCAAVAFFIMIGRTYGPEKLVARDFAPFSVAWLLIHVCLFLIVSAYWGLLYYLPILVVELWIGFMIAIWLFGPPTHSA